MHSLFFPANFFFNILALVFCCFGTGFLTRTYNWHFIHLKGREREGALLIFNEMRGFSFIKWHSKQNKIKPNDGKQNRTIV